VAEIVQPNALELRSVPHGLPHAADLDEMCALFRAGEHERGIRESWKFFEERQRGGADVSIRSARFRVRQRRDSTSGVQLIPPEA
jgi:hypothetical protein